LEGNTVVVRISIGFSVAAAASARVSPDGSEIALSSKPQPTARWSRRSRGRGDGNGCSMMAF
jgi:hypothetical protein